MAPYLPHSPDSPLASGQGLGKRSRIITYATIVFVTVLVVLIVIPSSNQNIQVRSPLFPPPAQQRLD